MAAFVQIKALGVLVAGAFAFGPAAAGAEPEIVRTAALSPAPSTEAPLGAPSATGFARLPPSGRMIAQALFEAQRLSPGQGPAEPWALDRIAGERQSGLGWGQVFRTMREEGLIAARSLSEAISVSRHLGGRESDRARYAEVSVPLGHGRAVLVRQTGTSGKTAPPPAPARRIDLGRVVVSDFDRGDGAAGRLARPFGAVRVFRD